MPCLKLQVSVASFGKQMSTWNLQDLLKRYHPDSMARVSRKTNKAGCKSQAAAHRVHLRLSSQVCLEEVVQFLAGYRKCLGAFKIFVQIL